MSPSRPRIVAGNWKMHGSRELIRALVPAVQQALPVLGRCQVVFCPPAPYLTELQGLLKHPRCALGAQDVSAHLSGAYTGEQAGAMLLEAGCRYVIVGHSERRRYHSETSELVAAKAAAALAAGLRPIICIGETLAERESERTWAVLNEQLQAIAGLLRHERASELVLAYEPVWAIGTGRTATPEQAQAVHGDVRQWLREQAGEEQAEKLPILYGGSVKADNAAALMAQPDVDGALVGGASLQADEFITICRSAE
jgi:triosephosphate isomerase (TIM)